MKTRTLTLFFFLCLTNLFAQQIKDELIVRLAPEVSGTDFRQNFGSNREFSEEIIDFVSIGPSWNMYKMVVQENAADGILTELNSNNDVWSVGYNFHLKTRDLIPNDVRYGDQWDMDFINAPEVWEFNTGGVTAFGDTIVIANLEYTDLDHEDLTDNIWINHKEIPSDSIDNDGNGYIDDYRGYNVLIGGDFVDINFLQDTAHGTQVSGIMAAVGNNNLGISGVNWNVKLMVVSSKLIFSDIVASYQYILTMRRLYNDTNGEKGAFIVSTNASFGESGFPSSRPIFEDWCEIYDTMGEAGILSVGATTNDNEDIDVIGDMPTSCPSDYLITVTNVNQARQQRGGFSPVNIDLGAPGTSTLSTNPFDEYDIIKGTSAATPHVTGSIGLLYSSLCESFMAEVKANPATAAKAMKSFLLNGTAPLNSLKDITLTEGVLDLKGSFNLIQNYCGIPVGPLDILTVKTNLERQEISIEYQTPESGPYTLKVYDAIGRLVAEGVYDLDIFDDRKIDIDLSHFATGVYFLSIENVENIVAKPFVVYFE